MPTDKLTDPKIRQAKPGEKPYKLFDGGGLFLLVQPNGHPGSLISQDSIGRSIRYDTIRPQQDDPVCPGSQSQVVGSHNNYLTSLIERMCHPEQHLFVGLIV